MTHRPPVAKWMRASSTGSAPLASFWRMAASKYSTAPLNSPYDDKDSKSTNGGKGSGRTSEGSEEAAWEHYGQAVKFLAAGDRAAALEELRKAVEEKPDLSGLKKAPVNRVIGIKP